MLMPTLAHSAEGSDSIFVKNSVETSTSMENNAVSLVGYTDIKPQVVKESNTVDMFIESNPIVVRNSISKIDLMDSTPSALNDWYSQKQRDDNISMQILTSWGLTSTIVGGVLMLGDDTDFGLMTASWGIINAGLGISALLSRKKEVYTHKDLLRDEILFNRIIAINSALNMSYILGGLALSHINDSPRLNSYGDAIIIQGAFLLIFDTVLLINSSGRLNRLVSLKEAVTIAPSLINTPSGQNLNYTNLGINVKFSL
jgi:hypothetical protein